MPQTQFEQFGWETVSTPEGPIEMKSYQNGYYAIIRPAAFGDFEYKIYDSAGQVRLEGWTTSKRLSKYVVEKRMEEHLEGTPSVFWSPLRRPNVQAYRRHW